MMIGEHDSINYESIRYAEMSHIVCENVARRAAELLEMDPEQSTQDAVERALDDFKDWIEDEVDDNVDDIIERVEELADE